MGITSDGQKRMLGLREGSLENYSENYEVTKDLLFSLIEQVRVYGSVLAMIRPCSGVRFTKRETSSAIYLIKRITTASYVVAELVHGSVEYAADALGELGVS